ncbi:small integral membrane protein 14, partial [Coccinella septempunctata]|uniref:small integral membrane protein 14 n=1 Tax=Coccinella septempunctata TaxID=41139 RepID=UPI001D08C3A9
YEFNVDEYKIVSSTAFYFPFIAIISTKKHLTFVDICTEVIQLKIKKMDPCECVWDHEFAMRRLLHLLRNSQTVCTDTECFDEGTATASGSDNVLLMTLILAVSFFLFFFRPRSVRNAIDSKPRNQDSHGAPPNPPPSTM